LASNFSQFDARAQAGLKQADGDVRGTRLLQVFVSARDAPEEFELRSHYALHVLTHFCLLGAHNPEKYGGHKLTSDTALTPRIGTGQAIRLEGPAIMCESEIELGNEQFIFV